MVLLQFLVQLLQQVEVEALEGLGALEALRLASNDIRDIKPLSKCTSLGVLDIQVPVVSA